MDSREARDAISEMDSTIHHMRCGAHTFQLAIKDALRKPSTQRFIAKVRTKAKNLRNPHKDATLRRHAGKGCVVDMDIRWGSTYLMFDRLVDLKDWIIELGLEDLPFTQEEWEKVNNLMRRLFFHITLYIMRCPTFRQRKSRS